MTTHTKPLLIFFTVVALALLLTSSAQAVEVSNWRSTDIPDGEIWITPAQEVYPQELAMVINYGESPLILRVNGTTALGQHNDYLTQVIEPRDAVIMAIPFNDVETTYHISITRDGTLIYEISKTRPSYLLPDPVDSGDWYISPPVDEEDLVYSQADWDAMLAHIVESLTLEVLLLSLLATIIGFCAGVVVKNLTKFLAPTDPISVAIYIIAPLDWWQGWTGIGQYWLLVIVGYVIAYFVWHIDYISPIRTDCKGRGMRIDPVVIYHPRDGDTRMAIQEQSWRGLARRMVGMHHYIGSDAALVNDWTVSVKKPYWPRIRTAAIWVEREKRTQQRMRVGWFHAIQRSTQWILADGSKLPKVELLAKINALLGINAEMKRDKMRIAELELEAETAPTRIAGEVLSYASRSSTMRILDRMLQTPDDQAWIDDESDESEMEDIEEIETEIDAEEDDEDGKAERDA